MSSARVVLDLEALQHNLGICRDLAGDASVFGVVKANAYGHGLLTVARALRGARPGVEGLAVANLDEAIRLRQSGDEGLVLLLAGVHNAEELVAAQRHQLALVVHSAFQVDLLLQHQALAPFKLWLKVDSGMHRLGLSPAEVPVQLARLRANGVVSRPPGLLTHLASADELEGAETVEQLACFDAVPKAGFGDCSAANSAGIMAWPASHYQWVRPGIMLYGVSPFSGEIGAQRGLRPVMQFSAPVIAIRQLAWGDRIGYGGAGRCERPTRVAVVAAGYGDGYPRHASQATPVLIGGRRSPLLGRVSMDFITVDITDDPGVAVGDEAILWGGELPVEEIARGAETIAYELLTRVTSRVRVEYRGDPDG
ncbi:MAG: alanine racemase [Gammaproteobacteria bacterium]|nr:alanine racemase [Gammaproteobacteria bacterium]